MASKLLGSPLHRRAVLTGALAGVTGLVAMPYIARAQSYKGEYKMSVVGNRPLGTSEAAFRWAELVSDRTQGRINIKVYPGSQLVGGDQTRELIAMRQGIIDCTVSSTINVAAQIKEMNLFSLPFLMPDSAAFDALTQKGEVRVELDAVFLRRGSLALAWSENGFRQLSNAKRDVRTPQDMHGLKIRYAAGPIFADIFSALGANPLQMSWADLQPALATGAVDGQETPINVFLQRKLYALSQTHLSIWNYVADANVFQFAKPVFDTFSKPDQEIVREAAAQAAREHTASSRTGLGHNGDRSSLEELAKHGVAVSDLTDAEKAEFRKATKSVFDKWAPQVGTDLVAKAEAAVAKKNG